MFSFIRTSTVAAAIALIGVASASAQPADQAIVIEGRGLVEAPAANLQTYWNIQRHLGVVPKFFNLFPEAKLPAVWAEYRDLELSTKTALDTKTKELIALAVAAQMHCTACIYFHSAAATVNGASGKEISEAVGLAIMVDTWSKVLTAEQVDLVMKDTNVLLSIGTLKVTPAATN